MPNPSAERGTQAATTSRMITASKDSVGCAVTDEKLDQLSFRKFIELTSLATVSPAQQTSRQAN
jgi:hypothetical protein